MQTADVAGRDARAGRLPEQRAHRLPFVDEPSHVALRLGQAESLLQRVQSRIEAGRASARRT